MKGWMVGLVFVIGVAVGVVGTLLGPQYARPYLPESLRAPTARVEGEVVRKRKEPDRLLLTVLTPDGAVLATFKARVTEIELLVKEGDLITLALARYEPFVENPEIVRVRKAGAAASGESAERPTPPATSPGAGPPATGAPSPSR